MVVFSSGQHQSPRTAHLRYKKSTLLCANLVVHALDKQGERDTLCPRVREHGFRHDARALPDLGHGLAELEAMAGDGRVQQDLRPAHCVGVRNYGCIEARKGAAERT
jgi:hypothetical protein